MRRVFSILLLIVLLMHPFSGTLAAGEQPRDEITILFTHDLHSNLLPFTVMDGNTQKSAGGFARLKTALDRERAGIEALVVDAGDFSMGTLFQTIFATEASELRLLGRLGYDAATLGNHEFDFGVTGLTDMLRSAAAGGDRLPQLLFHGGSLAFEEQGNPSTLFEDLSDAFFAAGAKQTMVIKKNGVNIGIFSVFGKEAVEITPGMEINTPDPIANAKKAVAELKEQGAELIVCLSHSGTKADKPRQSEDELLAKAVPDIDVIISGHTHTYLYEPIRIGDTTIVSCGEYGQLFGKLVVKRDGDCWGVKEYALLPIDADVEEDATIRAEIQRYQALVESRYLMHFSSLRKMKFDTVIARAPFASLRHDVYERHGESLLGNLIADAYYHTVNSPEKPVDVALAPAGAIRWGFPMGDITLADVFQVNSLGEGADGLSGYPLIDVYLTGRELRNIAEVDASVTPMMGEAQLYFSGMNVSFNPNRLIFNKVTDVYLTDEKGGRREIQDAELYRVVCGLHSAQMLGSIKSRTYGLLSIVPKDENGEEILDFKSRILQNAYESSELKEWYAIASYLMSFEETGGMPTIPAEYGKLSGRKIVEEEKGLSIYFSNMNGVGRVVFGIVLLIFLILLFLIYRLATRRKRKKWKKRRTRI